MATGGNNGDTETDAAPDTSSDVPKHYDVALLFAENDKTQALDIKEEMEKITLENGENPKICLYTDIQGAAAHTETGRNLTQVATLIFVLATENLQEEEVAKLIKDEAIGNTRLASKCHPGLKFCVRPLYLNKERKAHPPSGLSTIQEVRWYDKDSRCGQRDIRILLQGHIGYRKDREREDSRQRRTVGDTNGSRPPKDSNFAVSVESAHHVLQRDISPERTHLESSAAVRLSAMSQQSFHTVNIQTQDNTNGPSVQPSSANESSGVTAPGQSATERNNHQPSTMAKRNNNADHFTNPAQRSNLSRESYPSQDEASKILGSSPTIDTPESISSDADSDRKREIQTSGAREEQDLGTRNILQGSGCETDEGSIVESDLAQISLTTDTANAGGPNRDLQHTKDQIYTRNASSDSEPAEKDVSTSLTGKGAEYTQTTESLVGGNGKQSKGNPLDTGNSTGSLEKGTEHGTMTEKVLKHTGQAHRPTPRCAAPNDLPLGGGEKEPYGFVEPRVVHFHTHYHGEDPGFPKRGPPHRALPGEEEQLNRRSPLPLNIVRCSNVQIGSGQQIIKGIQGIASTSDDVQNDAPTAASPDDPPPPYSIYDANQGPNYQGYGVSHDGRMLPNPISDGSEETRPKRMFDSDDELPSEKMKPHDENEPVSTDGGSGTPSPGGLDSGFVDPSVQSPGTSTSDENPSSGAFGGLETDLGSLESMLGSGTDLLQLIPDSGDEGGDVRDASDTGETPRTVENELPARRNMGPDRATPPVDTPIIPTNVFRNKDSRRTFVYTEALKPLLKVLASSRDTL